MQIWESDNSRLTQDESSDSFAMIMFDRKTHDWCDNSGWFIMRKQALTQ